jgi:dolichyl-phosphate-mannose-protein mannosyltransferase
LPHGRLLHAVVLLALLYSLWQVGKAMVGALDLGLPLPSRIVAAFTFAVAFGSVAATLLGHAGALRPAPLLLVMAAAVLASSWLPERAVREAESRDAESDVAESLDAELLDAESRDPKVSRDRGLAARVETVAAVATTGAMVFGYLVEALRRFTLPLHGGPDDLSYHLSAIAVWQRWGDLRMLKFSMGDWGTAFYPILPELSGWMLLAPFRDSDVAARWSELPYAIASLVAVAAVARRLGVGRRAAVLAAVLYGVLRPVAALAFAAGNDHVTAFFTLAALDAALACVERPRLGRFVYLGTSLGLLVASKYLGIFNAVTVLALFVAALALRSWRRSDAGGARLRPAYALAVLLGTIALAGGYTYLRNWASTGNPLYPQPVRVGGFEMFAGREEMSLGARGGDERLDLWELLAGPDNAFAAFFPFTLLPAALLAPLLAAWRRRWLAAAVLALPAVFFLEYLHLAWDHTSIRFVFAGVALGGVAFVWLTEQLGVFGAWLRVVTFAVLLLRYARWLEVRGEWELLAALALVGCAALGRWTWPRWRGAALAMSRPLLAVATLAAILALGCNVERYQRGKLAGSPAAQALERLTGGRGAVVGYVGLNQPYLFFGSRLQNDVRIVPRSFNLRAEHYRWGGQPERPFPRSTYRRWLGVMHQLAVQYVVVVRSADEDPERAWMANHWERFRRVHVDETTEIWKLLPRPEPPPRPRGAAGHA